MVSSAGAKILPKNTTLIIKDTSEFDNNNHFVWYHVTIADSKITGYISSAYVKKWFATPTVNTVDNNDTSISGTAPANSTIQIMNGTKKIGTTTANTSGKFIAKIAKQKAKTKLTVTFKDQLNTPIPSVIKTVIDKTPPIRPTINTIKKTTKIVTGKTEAYASVQVKFGSQKPILGKANKDGKYTIRIRPQKVGTNVYVTATDAAKNSSETKTTVK